MMLVDKSVLYAGPIRNDTPQPCFQDIVLASICPPRNILISALNKKKMANRIVI